MDRKGFRNIPRSTVKLWAWQPAESGNTAGPLQQPAWLQCTHCMLCARFNPTLHHNRGLPLGLTL
jgi:hypothetical protein